MKQPFEFSVASGGEPSAAQWRDLVRATEDLGYTALHLNDHLGQPLAALPALAAAAAVTSTLRLGPRVANNDLRSPVLLAHEVASLDLLSGGRAELGVGAGWLPADYRGTGIPFDAGPRRAARLIEAFGVLDALLRGGPVSFHGEHYQVEVDEPLATVQRPRVPLVVGAGGVRLLTFAARHADGVSITGRTLADGGLDSADLEPERLDAKVGVVRAAAGPRLPELRLHHVVWECMVTPRPEALLAAYAAGMGVTPERLGQLPGLLLGSVPQIVDTLVERRERWGLSSVSVPAAAVRQFAPVVAALAGR